MIIRRLHKSRAMTLVEVLFTLVLVAFIGVAVIGTLAYGIVLEQSIHERDGAMRVATDTIESTKRVLFANLAATEETDVVIDDRGTTDTDDDVTATVSLKFYDMNGAEVGTTATPIPLDLSMLRAEVTVAWTPAGRRSADPQQIMLNTLLAP